MVISERSDTPATSPHALGGDRHLCLFYDHDPAEQMPVLAPFIRDGLSEGARCIYVADDQSTGEFSAALAAYGVDVRRETERGALLLWSRAEWRQPGELDSARKSAQVRAAIDDALAAGFRGVRFGVEMTWTLEPDIDAERLRHWESTINTIFTPDVPARIICQYNRSRLAPAALHAALSSHPLAVVGSETYANPFYDAPLVLEGSAPPVDDDAAAAGWKISRLRWLRAYERERQRRVRAEAALAVAQAQRRRAEELIEAATSATSEIRDAYAVADDFVSLVSHELRTPIATVLGNAKLLRARAHLLDEASLEQSLDDMVTEGERLVRIVDNMFLLARAGRGLQPQVEPIDVGRTVERAVREFRKRARHRVTTECPPGTYALAEASYVEQVMLNLLSNAQKYSPESHVVHVTVAATDAEVEVAVTDGGGGVEPDDLEAVFKPFFRGEDAARRAGGMGIGLTACKRLVEAMHGSIRAETTRGGGARFVFTLPALEAAPE
jgi:signal transduction histidine kinase